MELNRQLSGKNSPGQCGVARPPYMPNPLPPSASNCTFPSDPAKHQSHSHATKAVSEGDIYNI